MAGNNDDNGDDGVFGRTSLRYLSSSSVEALSRKLNRRRVIQTSDGRCRDYRGLEVLAGLDYELRQQVEHSQDPTRELIRHLCTRDVTVRHLIDWLDNLDRTDVRDDALEQLRRDCLSAQDRSLCDGVRVRIGEEVLTLDDVHSVRMGRPLAQYDVMLMHSDTETDVRFADDLRRRMEDAGLRVSVSSVVL